MRRCPGESDNPFRAWKLKLIDEEGSEIDASDDETIGEVVVRGPNVFLGYLNRPDATEEAMRDAWFMTVIWPPGTSRARSGWSGARAPT